MTTLAYSSSIEDAISIQTAIYITYHWVILADITVSEAVAGCPQELPHTEKKKEKVDKRSE